MDLLAPFLFCTFLGFFSLRTLLKKVELPYPEFFYLALSAPAGFALCSMLTFWGYVLSGTQAKLLSFILCYSAAILFFLDFLRDPQTKNLDIRSKLESLKSFFSFSKERILPLTSFALFLIVFFLVSKAMFALLSKNIFGGWDARYIWSLKAEFLFRDPGSWKNIFSPLLPWSHQDYPLLLPGAVAWGWNWAGWENPLWPAVIAYVFWTALCLLLIWYLASYASLTAAFIAGVFFMLIEPYSFWSISLYADVPFSLFACSSAFILLTAFKRKESQLFFLAGLLTGLSAWTKNEGLFYTVWIFLVTAIALFSDSKLDFSEKKRFSLSLLKGAAIPFASVLFLKFFLSPPGDFIEGHSHLKDFASLVFESRQKSQLIAQIYGFMMLQKDWNGLWILTPLAVLFYFVFRRKEKPDAWILLVLIAAINLGYFFVFHVTPHNLVWHLSTSVPRLLLHSGVLAIAFLFKAFGPPAKP